MSRVQPLAATEEGKGPCPAPHSPHLPSPPCLHPPAPKPLQAAPGSPEPLRSRFRPLTWQKAAFSFTPSRVGSTVAQGRIRWGWGALEDGASPSAAASWHLPPEAVECNFTLKTAISEDFAKTAGPFLIPVSPSGLAHANCSHRPPPSLQHGME